MKFKKIIMCLVLITVLGTMSLTVFALGDDNAKGDPNTDELSTVAGSYNLRGDWNSGVRIVVVDTENGRNNIVGTVNFMKQEIRDDEPVWYFKSQGWKDNIHDRTLSRKRPPSVVGEGLPGYNGDLVTWFAKDSVPTDVANHLGMVIDPKPDPSKKPPANVLNQKRYKLVAEPLMEAHIGSSSYLIIGTVTEIYIYTVLEKKRPTVFAANLGKQFAIAANNMALERSDIELDVPFKNVTAVLTSTYNNFFSTVVGDGRPGDKALFIKSFDGEPIVKPPDKPIPPPNPSKRVIKKNDVNGWWLDSTVNVISGFGSPPDAQGSWGFNFAAGPSLQSNIKYTDIFKGGASEGWTGQQLKKFMGNRNFSDKDFGTNPVGASSLVYSSTFNDPISGIIKPPDIVKWLGNGYKGVGQKDVPETRVVSPNSVGVESYWFKEGHNGFYCTEFGCSSDGVYQIPRDNGIGEDPTCLWCGGTDLDRNLEDFVDGGVDTYREPDTNPTCKLSNTDYGTEPTVFETSKEGKINNYTPTPYLLGNTLTQRFTLNENVMKFFPSYKMGYYDNLDTSRKELWMSSFGERTLKQSPEVTITVKDIAKPAVISPWSRDRVDVGYSLPSITKSGNAVKVSQGVHEVTTTLVYYVTDDFYVGKGDQTLTTDQRYLDVVNKLSDEFMNLHLYSNIPLTGTISPLNTNNANLTWLKGMSEAVQKKSLTGLPVKNDGADGGTAKVTTVRSNLFDGIDGNSKSTFNGSPILPSPTDRLSRELQGTNVTVQNVDDWYNEEYEGLVKVVITRTVRVAPPKNNWIEIFRGVSDWRVKEFKSKGNPIRYNNSNVYTGNDYVMGYASYFKGGSISTQPVPEVKVFSKPCTSFGIRGSAYDQVK